MASRKEYELLLKLNASADGKFASTFSAAQKELAKMQNELQALNRVQGDISAYQKQQQAVEKTQQKLALLQQQYDNIQKEIDETEGYSSSLENQLLSKQHQIDQTTEKVDTYQRKLDEMGEELRSAGVDTANLTSESERLGQEYKLLKSNQEEIAQSYRESGAEAQGFGEKGTASIEAVGNMLLSAGIVRGLKEIGEALIECTEESIEFESAVTGVYKTVDGSEQQLANIKEDIKQMSTEIPASTEEISAVAEAAGQLGIATDDVMSFTRVMIDLGESTNLEAEEAASSLAKFANITGTAAEEYSELGSVVVGLGNNFATTESDIVAMSTRLASAGTLAGLTEPEIMALAAAMSSVGIEAEAGGTAMTQTLSEIEKAVVQGGDKLAEFASVADMSAEEFAAAWETSPMETIQAFIEGIGSLDERGRNAVTTLDNLGLSGIRQSNMIKSLGLAADTLGDTVTIANKAWDENVALSQEAEKRYATTESKLAMLDNSFGNLKVAIGDVYTPALREATDLGVDFLNGATEFVKENPVLVKSLTATATAVGVVAAAMTAYAAAAKYAKELNLASVFSGPGLAAIAATAAITGVVGGIIGWVESVNEATVSVDELTEASRGIHDAMEEVSTDFNSQMLDIQATYGVAEAYIDKLEKLEETYGDEVTASREYNDILSLLTTTVPELSEYIDLQTGSIEGGTAALREQISAWKENAEAQAYQTAYAGMQESYNEVLVEQKRNEIELTAAETRLNAAKERRAEILERHTILGQEYVRLAEEEYKRSGQVVDVLQYQTEEYRALEVELQEVNETIEREEKNISVYNKALKENAEAVGIAETMMESYNTVMEDAIGTTEEHAGVTKEASELINLIGDSALYAAENGKIFQEAYENAYAGISSSFGLFEKVVVDTETGVQDMIAALDSQIQYMATYQQNLELVKQMGLSDALVSQLADGSTESAAYLQAIVNDGGKSIQQLNEKFASVEEGKKDFSNAVAEMETEFSETLKTMEADLERSVEEMNMADEAAESGRETVQGFIDGATSKLSQVKTAYAAVAAAAALAMSTTPVTPTGSTPETRKAAGSLNHYAGGTNYAKEGFAVVGENGPEIVYFSGGEHILNAQETAAMKEEMQVVAIAPWFAQQAFAPQPVSVAADSYPQIAPRSDNSTVINLNVRNEFSGISDTQEMRTAIDSSNEALVELIRETIANDRDDYERTRY